MRNVHFLCSSSIKQNIIVRYVICEHVKPFTIHSICFIPFFWRFSGTFFYFLILRRSRMLVEQFLLCAVIIANAIYSKTTGCKNKANAKRKEILQANIGNKHLSGCSLFVVKTEKGI